MWRRAIHRVETTETWPEPLNLDHPKYLEIHVLENEGSFHQLTCLQKYMDQEQLNQ